MYFKCKWWGHDEVFGIRQIIENHGNLEMVDTMYCKRLFCSHNRTVQCNDYDMSTFYVLGSYHNGHRFWYDMIDTRDYSVRQLEQIRVNYLIKEFRVPADRLRYCLSVFEDIVESYNDTVDMPNLHFAMGNIMRKYK